MRLAVYPEEEIMKIRILDYRPPKIAQLLVLTAALLHWATPPGHLHIYANQLLGIIVGTGGFAIMMWGWWLFRKFGTAICPTAKSQHLVTSGIYRFTRNPMYLGLVGMLLAIAIVVGTVPFYLAAVAYFVVINHVFCPYEESKLAETFGDGYRSYKNNVRRWV
jgi:protein-S-isoprenylcysteine O-methyltransferase Ste14